MFTSNIYIKSCASWLPESLTPIQIGIQSGEYNFKDAQEMGYQSIAIAAQSITVGTMAHQAAETALIRAQISGEQLAALTFNAVHRHGQPQLWCPASYLQGTLGAADALPLSIYQGCNGQLLAITMLSQLLQTSQKDYALSVSADQFSNGGINRWHGDYGIVYGDAAAAVVLSKLNGIAKVLSIKTVSDPSLEALHRFDSPIHAHDSDYNEKHYNVRLAKKTFLKRYGKDIIIKATQKAMSRLWEETFSNNAFSPEDVCYFIFPNLSEVVLDMNYFSVYPQLKKKSLWFLGQCVGHLGASDCVVGLDHLFTKNKLRPGDKILCIGAGSGFSWTFMLIEKV